MSAEIVLTPTTYINHHLAFNARDVGGGFWTIHMDTLVTSIFLGVVAFGFLWWVVRGATAGVPGKRQAFVELLFDFAMSTTTTRANGFEPVGMRIGNLMPMDS